MNEQTAVSSATSEVVEGGVVGATVGDGTAEVVEVGVVGATVVDDAAEVVELALWEGTRIDVSIIVSTVSQFDPWHSSRNTSTVGATNSS